MMVPEIAEKLLAAKKKKGLTFSDLGKLSGVMKSGLPRCFIDKPELLRRKQRN